MTVSDEDREVLARWSRRPTAPHSIAQRARIVLLAADGLSDNEVADKVGCNQATVVKWRKRFIERGLDGLPDDPRPGAPRSISDDDVEAVIVRTLETSPRMRRIGQRVISPRSRGSHRRRSGGSGVRSG